MRLAIANDSCGIHASIQASGLARKASVSCSRCSHLSGKGGQIHVEMIRQFIFAFFVLGLFGCDGGPPTADGYTYKTVKIGNQEWLAENLRTTVYANGDPISYSRTQDSWATLDMGMRCSYRHED